MGGRTRRTENEHHRKSTAILSSSRFHVVRPRKIEARTRNNHAIDRVLRPRRTAELSGYHRHLTHVRACQSNSVPA